MAKEKEELRFEGFLSDIDPKYTDIVGHLHDFLIGKGCGIKIQLAKSGHVVSFSDAKTKRVVANFVSRKNGPIARIYGDNSNKYIDFLEALPEEMIKAIGKSPSCKRLIDPEKCNSRCPMGYDLTIKGTRYQKCRYGCFMFDINAVSAPYIKDFFDKEIAERTA